MQAVFRTLIGEARVSASRVEQPAETFSSIVDLITEFKQAVITEGSRLRASDLAMRAFLRTLSGEARDPACSVEQPAETFRPKDHQLQHPRAFAFSCRSYGTGERDSQKQRCTACASSSQCYTACSTACCSKWRCCTACHAAPARADQKERTLTSSLRARSSQSGVSR